MVSKAGLVAVNAVRFAVIAATSSTATVMTAADAVVGVVLIGAALNIVASVGVASVGVASIGAVPIGVVPIGVAPSIEDRPFLAANCLRRSQAGTMPSGNHSTATTRVSAIIARPNSL